MMDDKEKIKVKAVLEIMGSPKEHVKSTMSMLLDKLKDVKEIEILEEKTAPPMEVEPKPFWSSFCELELEFKDENVLFGFCFDFMPSSIEILSPDKILFPRKVYEDMINDLLARLHHYDMLLKNTHAQNIVLRKEIEKISVDKAQPKPSDLVVEDDEDKKD